LNNIIIRDENKSLVFGIIYFYLYYLKLETVPELQMSIILEKLPSLSELDDIFITNKVVKIVNLYYNHKSTDSSVKISCLSSVGLRALFEIWKRQPKIWNQLKYNISTYVSERCSIDREPDEALNEFDISYISILHDVCDHNIKECGQESIAWIKSLFGIKHINPTCQCLLLDTLNKCIENDIINARAAWILIINEFVNSLKENTHHLIYKYLFQYYNLISKKTEDTDIYYEFKSLILSNYILPLLSSKNAIIRSYVIDTISLYPVSEMIEHLPGPSDIVKFTEHNINDDIVKLYTILINNEITNMKSYKNNKNNKIDDSKIKLINALKDYASKISEEWYKEWKDGNVSVGKKSGIMLSILHSLLKNIVHIDNSQKINKENNMEIIQLMNSFLEDIDFSDSVTSRIGIISSWCAFFENQFMNIDHASEIKSELFLYAKDLFNDKMRNSAIPSICANSFMAYTGLVIAYHKTNNSSYQYINEWIDNLLQYSNPDSYIHNEYNNNDDIRFSIIISLTHLYSYIHATDERRKKNIFNQFMYLIHTISDKNSWQAFSLTYGLGHILNVLVQSLSNESQDTNKSLQKNDHMEILKEYKEILIKGFDDPQQRETLEFYGRKLGFVKLLELDNDSILSREALTQILKNCYKEIEYLFSGTELKYIEGDFWILTYASLLHHEGEEEEEEEEGEGEDENANKNKDEKKKNEEKKKEYYEQLQKIEPIFDQAMNYIRTKDSHENLYIHLFSSYCYHKYFKFIKKMNEDTDEILMETISYRSQLLSIVHLFNEDSIANNTKISSIFGTMALLGVNIIDFDCDSTIILQEYPDLVKDILEKLQLLYSTATGKSLKDARLTYILQSRLIHAIDTINMNKKTPLENEQNKNKFKSEGNNEPKDYSRLPLKTSYLRIIFNTLNKLSKGKKKKKKKKN